MGRFKIRFYETTCILVVLSSLGLCRIIHKNSIMGSSRDLAADPCENFYEYICGGRKTHNSRTIDVFADYQQKLDAEVEEILLEEIPKHKEPSNVGFARKLSDYYRTCVNFAQTGFDEEGWKLLLSTVSMNGGWPLTFPPNKWTLENKNLTLIIIHQRYAKIVDNAALFDIRVVPYDKDATVENVLVLKLAKPREVDPHSLEMALKMTHLGFTEQGKSSNSAYLRQEIAEMIEFAESLSQLKEEAKNSSSGQFTIAKLQQKWNKKFSNNTDYSMNWIGIVKTIFSMADMKIRPSQTIYLEPRDLVDKLGDLLIKHKLKTVVNYIHWCALADLAPYVDMKFARSITGLKTDLLSSELRFTGPINDHGMFYLYVKKYFKDFTDTRNVVSYTISRIVLAMKTRMSISSWISKDVKEKFQAKLDGMINEIGYPAWYDDANAIDEYMKNLEVGENRLMNEINYNVFRKIKNLQKLGKPFDRHEWERSIFDVTGAYDQSRNSMILPVTMLREPFFDPEEPSDIGFLAYMIGHELVHAIDSTGQLYDKIGLAMNLPEPYKQKYNEIGQCFIDQYSNYRMVMTSTERTVPVDGTYTFAENFADNVGVKLAWDAFTEAHDDGQQFFRSFTKPLCTTLDAYGENDEHARMDVRINGMVSNMREFSKAFNCKIGRPLNPKKKCDFWDGNMFS